MSRCATCGAAVSWDARLPAMVRRCPRCGYRGDGIPYFRRASHVALLVGVSIITYGLGGLGYWLLRRNHFVCPNCGLGWHHMAQALPLPWGGEGFLPAPRPKEEESLPWGGMGRRVFGLGLVLLATVLVVGGIVGGEVGLIVAGSGVGAAGTGSFWWGLRALHERRKALMQRLQQQVLRLATHRGGTLTVTEVAAELNLSLPAAEKVLVSMDDGFRVRSEISREGVLFYEFPEVMHRSQLEPGAGG